MADHIPNTIHTITVMITFSMALIIIYEASLSFLGLDVPPAIPTWGSILSEGRSYMHRAPWLSIIPGMAIFISVLGINLLGDGLTIEIFYRGDTFGDLWCLLF